MSRPRAATSVAISRFAFCARNNPITRSRCFCIHAAVQRLGAMAVGIARFDERLHLEPRAAEDERGDRILHVENPLERRRLLGPADDICHLTDPRHLAGRRFLARDGDANRIFQVPRRNRQNARRHRRREERRLSRRRRCLENRIEILGEPHVEHFVRFVEDEHPKGVELQRSPSNVIERAAGRRHDDLRSALELANLSVHRRAAVHRQHRQPNALGVFVNGLGDLHRQLARRHENQSRGLARVAFFLADALQHRQRECRRLAGACGGLPEQVPARDQQGNRLALYGSRLFVAQCCQNVGKFG